MSARTYESLVEGQVGNFAIRVWRSEPNPDAIYNEDLIEHLSAMHDKCQFDPTYKPSTKGLVDELAEFPRVAAVQVKDSAYNTALLVYIDWPN